MPEAYRLVLARSARREFRKLPQEDISRILRRIEQLASDPRPHGCEKLAGTDLYRIRQGDYLAPPAPDS